ncbi:MAG: hypothetical protein IKV55_05300 [Oscillospiraceae bacterium]|nr:hypothetical protein [Oscillospiraceae bacterium]
MNHTNCPNCGAPLDRRHTQNGNVCCQYCGTVLPAQTDEERLRQAATEFITDTFESTKHHDRFMKVFFTIFIAIFATAFLFILFTMFSMSRAFRFFGF